MTSEMDTRWKRLMMQLLYDIAHQPGAYREEFNLLENLLDEQTESLENIRKAEDPKYAWDKKTDKWIEAEACSEKELEEKLAFLKRKFEG